MNSLLFNKTQNISSKARLRAAAICCLVSATVGAVALTVVVAAGFVAADAVIAFRSAARLNARSAGHGARPSADQYNSSRISPSTLVDFTWRSTSPPSADTFRL